LKCALVITDGNSSGAMNFMKRKTIILSVSILIVLICGITVLLSLQPFSLASTNERMLKKTISSLSDDVEVIKINELIPFEWDYVYTFYPYMNIEEIEDIIGFRSNKIYMAESENIQQLLFVKDDKVVCNIFGSSSNLNFHFDLGEFENRYVKIRKTDQHSFSVEVRDEIKYFSIIK